MSKHLNCINLENDLSFGWRQSDVSALNCTTKAACFPAWPRQDQLLSWTSQRCIVFGALCQRSEEHTLLLLREHMRGMQPYQNPKVTAIVHLSTWYTWLRSCNAHHIRQLTA